MLEVEKHNFEKTAIVGLITQNQSEEKLNEYLDELEFLTFTAGGEVVKRFSQKTDKPHPKTFVGTGKLEEIKVYIKEHDINSVIFDDELTPSLRYFCTTCRNFLCQNASRIGAMYLFITTINGNVDTLRTSTRWNWNAWTWRNRN